MSQEQVMGFTFYSYRISQQFHKFDSQMGFHMTYTSCSHIAKLVQNFSHLIRVIRDAGQVYITYMTVAYTPLHEFTIFSILKPLPVFQNDFHLYLRLLTIHVREKINTLLCQIKIMMNSTIKPYQSSKHENTSS